MILLAFPYYERLASELARLGCLRCASFSVHRFPNGELHATVEAIPASHCILLASIAPPDENLLMTLLVAHTVKKAGAHRVTALLPYLAYARQDKEEAGKSLGAAWAGALIDASGVDDVVTVDVHSPVVPGLFPMPLRSLSPAPVFAAELATFPVSDLTVVAPDEGAIPRAEAVRRAIGVDRPISHFKKQRGPVGISHSTLHGHVGRRAVVIDDILDTGSTLVSACEGLRAAGAEEIVVMVTHGLFTGTAWERLWSGGGTRVYCTDSVPLPQRAITKGVRVLSLAPVLLMHLTTAQVTAS